jgi:hypothetical protein
MKVAKALLRAITVCLVITVEDPTRASKPHTTVIMPNFIIAKASENCDLPSSRKLQESQLKLNMLASLNW